MATPKLPPSSDDAEHHLWNPRARRVDPFVTWLESRLAPRRYERLLRARRWRRARWWALSAALLAVASLLWCRFAHRDDVSARPPLAGGPVAPAASPAASPAGAPGPAGSDAEPVALPRAAESGEHGADGHVR